jgi:Flp pilus assembly protein TadD
MNKQTLQSELLSTAHRLLSDGELAEAEFLLRRLLANFRADTDAHQLLGGVLEQTGREAEAKTIYARAAKLNPALPAAIIRLAELALAAGDAAQAQRWLDGCHPACAADARITALRQQAGAALQKSEADAHRL